MLLLFTHKNHIGTSAEACLFDEQPILRCKYTKKSLTGLPLHLLFCHKSRKRHRITANCFVASLIIRIFALQLQR